MDLWKNPKYMRVKTLNGVRYVARVRHKPTLMGVDAPFPEKRKPTKELRRVYPCPLMEVIIFRDHNKGKAPAVDFRIQVYITDDADFTGVAGIKGVSYVITQEYWDSLLEIPELKSAQVYWEMTK